MKDISKYQGIIPAFYACYDDEGKVSAERRRGLCRIPSGPSVSLEMGV